MTQQLSVINAMAEKYGMEKAAFEAVMKKTVFPAGKSNEEFVAFLMVAKTYNLNPLLKEVYAFPTRGGGIMPIVSIDGWINIINSHPEFDGMEFEDNIQDGKLTAITCKIYRKDRNHPVEVTEYLSECSSSSEPWKKWPYRMLRHKATIQCARYAFGFSGIVDEDEARRIDIIDVPVQNNQQPKTLAAALENNKPETVNTITLEQKNEVEQEITINPKAEKKANEMFGDK